MGRMRGYMSVAYEWIKRHKIISIILIISAVLMLFGRFASTGASTASESSSVDKDALRSCVYGFVEQYGSWSWQGPFDTETLKDYAHADLVADIIEQRIADYVTLEETQDPEAAKSLAAQRMQQDGAVRVASIESIDVLSSTDEAFEIEIQVSEYSYSNEAGLSKQECSYSIGIEKTREAGITAAYQVVRFIKN